MLGSVYANSKLTSFANVGTNKLGLNGNSRRGLATVVAGGTTAAAATVKYFQCLDPYTVVL